jgi:hypothetical protein
MRLPSMFLAMALALVGGCGPATPDPAYPSRSLPAYEGRSTELFDDGIEPRAVGIEVEATGKTKGDAALRERTQVGDATLRVRVSTVTSKDEDTGTTYQVGFRTLEKLAGQHPPGEEFVVRVDRTSTAAGILKSFEGRLVGMTFIAFVRAFVRPDGDHELHFHLAPDKKDVLDAVHAAMALGELQGS